MSEAQLPEDEPGTPGENNRSDDEKDSFAAKVADEVALAGMFGCMSQLTALTILFLPLILLMR